MLGSGRGGPVDAARLCRNAADRAGRLDLQAGETRGEMEEESGVRIDRAAILDAIIGRNIQPLRIGLSAGADMRSLCLLTL